jgi:glycosyltransferase involved in cell wall biosynthesis
VRILHVASWFFWNMGLGKGKPSMIRTLEGMVKAGHEVHFLFPRRREDPQNGIHDGIQLHAFDYGLGFTPDGRDRFSTELGRRAYDNALYFWGNASLTFHAVRAARRLRPDLVYVQSEASALAGWAAARAVGAPFIVRSYGGSEAARRIEDPLWRLRQFRTLLYAYRLPAEHFIIVDDGTRMNTVAARMGVPEEKISYWKNGVDFSMADDAPDGRARARARLGLDARRTLLLVVGRLVAWKRPGAVLDAVAPLLEKFPHATLVFVGDGPERAALEARITNTLAGRVVITGEVDRAQVARWLNAADVVLSLADFDNTGNNLWETMVVGRAFVVDDNPAVREAVGDAATLVDSNDARAVGAAVERLLADGARREELARALRERGRRLLEPWPARIARELVLLESIVARRRAGGAQKRGAA